MTDHSEVADLINLRKINPDAAAYEISPGKAYIFVLGPLTTRHMHEDFAQALKRSGFKNFIVLVEGQHTPINLQVFGLETTDGAVVELNANRYLKETIVDVNCNCGAGNNAPADVHAPLCPRLRLTMRNEDGEDGGHW